jgi:hypothetical protein
MPERIDHSVRVAIAGNSIDEIRQALNKANKENILLTEANSEKPVYKAQDMVETAKDSINTNEQGLDTLHNAHSMHINNLTFDIPPIDSINKGDDVKSIDDVDSESNSVEKEGMGVGGTAGNPPCHPS